MARKTPGRSLAQSFLLGLTLALSIGPIALLIVAVTLESGLAAGLACGAGAALADFSLALLAFAAGSLVIPLVGAVARPVSIAGGLLLVGLGAWLAYAALRKPTGVAARPRTPGVIGTYALTVVNPLTLLTFASWMASHASGQAGSPLILAAAVLAGSGVVQASIAAFAWGLRRWLAHPAAVRALGLVSSTGIAAFGVAALLNH